jgi:hypothetical protein
MDSEIKQRLIRVIGLGGYGAAAICFLFGLYVYLAGYEYIPGVPWRAHRDGIPLMFWGVGLFIVTAAALYVIDGRTPITREMQAKLLSPSTPYWKFALLAVGAAAVSFVISDGSRGLLHEASFWLFLLGVTFAVLFAVMAVVVKRR